MSVNEAKTAILNNKTALGIEFGIYQNQSGSGR